MQIQETQNQIATPNGIPTTLYTLFPALGQKDVFRNQPAWLDWAQREFLHYAGGLTRFQCAIGFWIDPSGRVYRDVVIPFQVVAPIGQKTEDWFISRAGEMAVMLGEQQIFLIAQTVWRMESTSVLVNDRVQLNGSENDLLGRS